MLDWETAWNTNQTKCPEAKCNVWLSHVLVNNPAVILAVKHRKPCSRTSFEILVLFQQLHAEGRTIIFVTHNPDLIQYSSRNIRLRDGKVIEDSINKNIMSAAEALAAMPKSRR